MKPTGEVSAPLPVYIVGLDDNDIESSLAKTKFQRSIESLSHLYPELGEAQSHRQSILQGEGEEAFRGSCIDKNAQTPGRVQRRGLVHRRGLRKHRTENQEAHDKTP